MCTYTDVTESGLPDIYVNAPVDDGLLYASDLEMLLMPDYKEGSRTFITATEFAYLLTKAVY